MAIYRAVYAEEIVAAEGNVSKLFVNDNYIYNKFRAVFVRTENGYELASGTVFVRDVDGWVNLDTGEVINN